MAQMTVKVIDVLAFLGYRCPGSSQLTIRIDDNNLLSLHGFRLNGDAIRLPRVGFCFGGGSFLAEKIKGWKPAGVFL
jgi:hypothetical protein